VKLKLFFISMDSLIGTKKMTKLFLTLFDLYGVTRDSLRVSDYPTKDQMPLPFFAAS